MSIRREDIEVTTATQEPGEPVVLVRSAWEAEVWDNVRADILARSAAGQTPVTLSHLEQLGLTEVVRLLAIDPETP